MSRNDDTHVSVDSLGQVVVVFGDGTQILLYQKSGGRTMKNSFEIRVLDRSLAVHMTGASNVMRVELLKHGGER